MNKTVHHQQLPYLRKIGGQVCGIQKMIEEGRYCIDVLTQLNSVVGAIQRIEENILAKHLEVCVVHALKGKSETEKVKKIDEIIGLVKRFRRH